MHIVMAFGTFDLIHPGHLHFLRQAHRHGDHLIVVIARDQTVSKLKGTPPLHTERERQQNMKDTALAENVILGNIRNHLRCIETYRPAVIALGYDQTHFTDSLRADLDRLGLKKTAIVRISAFQPKIYKTSLLKKAAESQK